VSTSQHLRCSRSVSSKKEEIQDGNDRTGREENKDRAKEAGLRLPSSVRRETKRQIFSALESINKKDLGRRVRAEEFLALALSLITPTHLDQLQSSLTNADRLERDYRDYVAQHGPLSRDEYLGKRLTGEIPPPRKNENLLNT
jgi:hypothetical protein